jgi:NAD(P)-dependent dehydrogenase (short-subunit alcohol dehydrogenase family)
MLFPLQSTQAKVRTMTQPFPFGFSSTATEVLSGVDLTGKTMIVTGGASGIGIETVRSLAAAGASVTIAARRTDMAEEVARMLRKETRNGRIDVRPLDLSNLSSVKRFVETWERPVHALINNAGVMALPELQRSAEGYEMQFATNFLGHFALTLGLRRHLAKAGNARVVSVSSTGSLFGPVLWDDPHFHFIPYDPLLAYAQSKTACILLSVGIRDHWASDGIVSNALNPGAIATNLQRHTGGLRTPEEFRKTPEQGAATSVLLAASPRVEGLSGRYFDDCQEALLISQRPAGRLNGVAPYALDSDNAERLWDMALRLVGEAR